MTMTIDDLIERLEDYRDQLGGDTEVRLMTQQNWPFENSITGLASMEEIHTADEREDEVADADNDPEAVLYIVEGQQLWYGIKDAWNAAHESRNARGGVAAGGSRRLMMAAQPSRTIFTRSQNMARKKSTTAKETKSTKAKPAAKTKGTRAASGDVKKLSAVGAAAKVLGEAREPMNCQELIDAMAAKGYWSSPGGKTPASTLYAAILREINTKGNDSRFKKADRGTFAINA